MKKLLGITFFLASFVLYGNATEKTIDSKIESVTVFLRGAQIKRSASTQVTAGVTLIKLEKLSPNIDPNSIEVSGLGNFTILSVTHGTNFLNAGKKSAVIVSLEDSLEDLQNELTLKTKLNVVLESEWNLINENKIVNNNTGFDIEDLDDLAKFYRERLSEIVRTQMALKKEQTTIQQNMTRIQQQLNELNNRKNAYTGEIVIEVMADAAVKTKFEIGYYVQNAGWTPTYDIRVKDSNSPINLSYKANIYQNTGISWDNVKLTLSTGNPTQGGTKPTFNPWRLGFIEDVNYGYITSQKEMKSKPTARNYELQEMSIATDDESFDPAQSTANYTNIVETTVNSSFEISIPKTIPSDGKHHSVSVQDYELKAEYNYFAAPKLDKDVFLVGRISGWEDYNLLSGSANIFYDGTYTGKSFIDVGKSLDTLDLSLGRDNGIIVNRTKIKEFTQKQIVGLNKKETVGFAISIRNTKSIPVKINLMDQLPVSKDASIEVEVLEISGANHDLQTGYLNWEVQLEPAETMNYVIKYVVKYPKDKKINL